MEEIKNSIFLEQAAELWMLVEIDLTNTLSTS